MHHDFDEILLVYKKSKYDLYIREKKNRRYQTLLDEKSPATSAIVAAHEAHKQSLTTLKAILKRQKIPVRTVYRARLKHQETERRLVITVGGDGTVLDASHTVHRGVLLGVNSDPERSVGLLCAATTTNFESILAKVLDGTVSTVEVPRLSLRVDDELFPAPILNDVLISHRNPAATTQVLLPDGNGWRSLKNSGIWIAGPAGTTAAILSAGGDVLSIDDQRLQFVIREPYFADERTRLPTKGFITKGARFRAVSKMREGVIFVDGPHLRISFHAGATVEISVGDSALTLVFTDEMTRRRAVFRQLQETRQETRVS